MKRFTKLLGLSVFTLALAGATGCKGKGDSKNPDGEDGENAVGTAENPSPEAKEDFAKAVKKYESAKGSAEKLPQDKCESVANAFSKVYKDHGEQMIISEFNAGAAYQECGMLDKAKAVYQPLADKEKYHLAYNNLGVLLWDEGKTAKALEMFKKSVDADRIKAFAARNNLAAAHRDRYAEKADQKDFAEAEKQIQNVLAVDTSNQSAYENLARLYYDRGRIKDKSYLLLSDLVVTQALRVLDKTGAQSADIWNLKGLLFLERADNQVDALRAFKKAVEIDKDHVDANLNIAFIAIRFRDYTTAEASLKIAMKDERVKRDIDAHIAMGVAKRGQKKYKEALKAYGKAAEVDSKDPRPWFNMGILHQEHMISMDGVDQAKIEEFYGIAKKHYNKFISMAESDKSRAAQVQDAKDRIIVIDDAIETFRKMEELQKQADALAKQEAEEAKKERERLLELERKAREAAGGGGDDKKEEKKEDAK